jgi:hypothetical protein
MKRLTSVTAVVVVVVSHDGLRAKKDGMGEGEERRKRNRR